MAAAPVESLLAAWDLGCDRSHTHRALALVAVAQPGSSPEQCAALPVGERDRRLMELRAALFGDAATGTSHCPRCTEQVEVAFRIGDVLATTPQPHSSGVLVEQGFEITFRPPTSADLLALTDATVPHARDWLLACCVRDVRRHGSESSLDTLPATVVDKLVDALEGADPGAWLEFGVDCPTCGNSWLEPFDVVTFLWAEIDHWAHRRLREVHELARAYGWREHDILAMSARRRRIYLELAGAS